MEIIFSFNFQSINGLPDLLISNGWNELQFSSELNTQRDREWNTWENNELIQIEIK